VHATVESHNAGVDKDGDGVPDSEDWCIGGQSGHVGPDGCPLGAVGGGMSACLSAGGTHNTGQDADSDGVADSEDWCAGTARGTRVGPDGCGMGEVGVPAGCVTAAPTRIAAKPRTTAKDSDADGVADVDDECLGTTKGMAVDNKGCALIEQVVLKGVNFPTKSATLKASAHDSLRSVAAAMKANDDLKIEVQGYTDSVGTDENNLALSQRRAEAVKAFLVKEGIAADRIEAKGYGEADPVDSNDTPAGRANNRRVAFKVLED
jgi:OOP family OmpA-OmpF porin